MFLDLANKSYHIANGAEETVMDRMRSLNIWQSTIFWEDYFFVRVNQELRAFHKPTVLHAMVKYSENTDEEKKEIDAGEQEIVFNVLARFAFDMSKLAVPASSIRTFTAKMVNVSHLNSERRELLNVLVSNMEKMELPEMQDLEKLDDIVTGTKDDEFVERHGNTWINVQGGDAKWHMDFSNFLAVLVNEENNGISSVIDQQVKSQQHQRQQRQQSSFMHESSHNKSMVMEKVLSGHTAPVLCLSALPNKILASGSCDNTIRIWNTRNCSCISTLKHHSGWVNCLEYDPVSLHLLSGSYDRFVTVWDSARLTKLHTMRGHEGSITCITPFSRGNVISASMDNKIMVWDTRAKRPMFQLLGHEKAPLCLRTVGDHILLSGGRDNSLRVWDLRNGQCFSTMVGHTDWVKCILFTGTPGDFVPISAGLDGRIIRWNISEKKPSHVIKAHDGGINQIVFSPYCESLVSVGSYGAVKLWDPFTLKFKNSLEGHTDEVTRAVSFGKFIATGSADHKVKLWNPLVNQERRSAISAAAAAAKSPALDAAAAPDGGLDVSTSSASSTIDLPLCRQTLAGHTLQVSDMCELDEYSLATSGWDSTVRLWEISRDFN